MTATTALYRRYRPDSFADVIGQEHVTEPLMTALRKNRVNHAYLFSGPRGCGKTTSARILARCLNCAKGPTDTPCGTCASCIELARGGSGSLDVIEIDAASHGGVDDARDLRERATFAPVRDRYKIFIIDEAHMVTSAGFNALLKIVEEPPEHIKFIFATTEPDKVIGTIRSRTHHYPFRLVPPEPLLEYLELLCRQENVPVAPGVLSLVIRAGGGSVRDTLSVLDQLMAGAGTAGLDYELAVALLGYTHATLLDDVVDAIAASDSATVFRAVDRVIQTGHDPRRFVEDLLERFRDLIIVRAMPESAATVLRGMPADQIARLQNQSHNLGASELSRAADVTNTALTEMTGATSPRLHLELLCARILLPSAEETERGIAARIDRVERRLSYAGNDVGSPTAVTPASASASASASADDKRTPDVGPAVTDSSAPPASPAAAAATPGAPAADPAPASAPASASEVRRPAAEHPATPAAAAESPRTSGSSGAEREQVTPPRVSTNDWPREDSSRPGAAPAQAPAPAQRDAAATSAPGASSRAVPPTAPPSAASPASSPAPSEPAGNAPAGAARPQHSSPPAPAPVAGGGHGDVEVLRRAWPDVLQTLSKIKRSTWALVEPNAKVSSFDGQVLTLAFTTSGLAGAFGRADHSDNLRQAITRTVGIDCQITAVAGGSGPASAEPNPKAPTTPGVPPTSVDEAWGLVPNSSASAAGPDPVAAPVSATAASQAGAWAAPSPVEPPAAHPTSPLTAAQAAPTATPSAAPARTPVSAAAPAPAQTSGTAAAPAPAQTPVPAAAPAPAAASAPIPASAPAPEPASKPAPAGAAASTGAAPAAVAPSLDSSVPDAGLSSYSDDDWGPPLDEDAPPLDEEPPLDWLPPSPGAGSVPSPPSAPAGSGGRAPSSPVPVPGAAGVGRAASSTDDPWSRAVEQAPGVWQVAAESNVARPLDASPPATPPVATPPATPPVATAAATAATPPVAATAATQTDESPDAPASLPSGSTAGPDDSGWGLPDSGNGQPLVHEPAYAMASAAPVASAAPAAPPASAPAPSGRQSLYQRLSNSPEAQAGRARVAQSTVAAAAPYAQDIPDPEDETIEESGVFGRAAVERILGGKLIDERSLDGSPLPPRF